MDMEQSEISVKTYIEAQEQKTLLRFITCGSVDDGKSTLIGRMLYESRLLFADQIEALKRDSVRSGTQGDDIDFALLVDGLASEREQGITIDVAYRFFSTDDRKFIVIDTPGHEQYTRNMATGASQAQLAVLLVDARQGLSTQTRRHSFIVNSLGVKHIVLAINKMDIVGYSQEVYNNIVKDYQEFAKQVGDHQFMPIPISALKGDNIIESKNNMPWYSGSTLMAHLNSVPIEEGLAAHPFRMHVQWVNRPNLNFRGFSGRIASGTLRPNDEIVVMPSGNTTKIEKILTMNGELTEGLPNESVTLCLRDEIDISRGDVLCSPQILPHAHNRFEAHLLWMSEEALRPGQTYLMKIGTQMANATISKPKYLIDVNSLAHLTAKSLALNEIGLCILNTDTTICFEPYAVNHAMGGFILINRLTNTTIAMGLIEKNAEATSMELRTQELAINQDLRAQQKNQKPVTLWFTGLKLSGKTFIANVLERRLYDHGNHTIILDPENMWKGLSDDLNYMGTDRMENIRRVAHVAKLMNEAGLIVITCFISASKIERKICQQIIGDDNFMEIYVDTPLEIAEAQDTQGFYKRARKGEIKNFAGVDIPYEAPEKPDLVVGAKKYTTEEAAEKIYKELVVRGIIQIAIP